MSVLYLAHCPLEEKTGHEAGRQLLQALWESHVGGEMPEIEITQRGKPCFAAGHWHFSISHTRQHAFCVLSDAPVGLDAEEADRRIDLRLAEKILSPAEKAQFDAAADKKQALLRFWVLKEAAAKLSGDGLRGYPNHTDFSLADSRITQCSGCLVAILQEEHHAL